MEEIRQRVIIEAVSPQIDCGRFAARRAVGEQVQVEADVFADGHDVLGAEVLYRRKEEKEWHVQPMSRRMNDRWQGSFLVGEIGTYTFKVHAWIDRFLTWRSQLQKKIEAGQDVSVELLGGAGLVEAAAERAGGADADRLSELAEALRNGGSESAHIGGAEAVALDAELLALMSRYGERRYETRSERELEVRVQRPRARFSAWYELFPRSASPEPGRHGTFRDVIDRLPYVAGMGFDVLYLPPIHPIGHTRRKGPNNSPDAGPGDPGSPWAIGSEEGGHKAIHPRLGTLEDFRALVKAAEEHGLEIALDIAFQCSPDHPWVKEHPEWFVWRADGTVQYAENPPKKYQDIYPLRFDVEHADELKQELFSVFEYWIEQGVRIFRVDNPHTKSLRFWEWVIGAVEETYPGVIFLSEAFTRPKVMYRLAKGGFTQSYTYFTWRNHKWELERYLNELNRRPVSDFFWPNLWPNTPDILPEYLQYGGRPAFLIRLILAATLSSSYGIYGPPFELGVSEPIETFSEEYRDSEKYQIHHWDVEQANSLRPLITRINRIRRENEALRRNESLQFHEVDRDEIICYSKHNEDRSNIILTVVNLDPYHTQSAWIRVPLEELGLSGEQTFQMHDLITGARYLWHADRNYLELDPHVLPAHIFRVRRRVRTERDFDYFM